ncbi:hypothetical protein LEP1GSC041_1975 [Leptospira noguchii str. 2006001870]|nr:hypothetical protein LEP1GSC041_1975 [Leptospira noguchii str. 2006001870]
MKALFLSLDSINALPANEIPDLKRKSKYLIINETKRFIRMSKDKVLQKESYSDRKNDMQLRT